MYRLYNYLFGWDYITWTNSADEGISRVRSDKNGNVYYWRYSVTSVADPVVSAKNHLWLTCEPSKYGIKG